MSLIVLCIVVFSLLLVTEWWARRYGLQSELSRKFIHITVGSIVAFLPLWLSWNQIRLLSLAFLVVVSLSKYLHIFRAIHSVTRPTWGEVYFAAAVGLTTFVTQNIWIYAVALLHMSIADGLAAIIGVRYGRKNRYTVLGQQKSLAGSAAFLFTSYVLLLSYSVTVQHIAWPLALVTAGAATVLENVALRGLDNLIVPLFIAVVLRVLA
ncbi:MAG TPA: hypothetical protein VFN56_04685 [Candidatus Saccharimonadales bacterium]|nr:hypothetical protein [Candidatus Saccharimonadales bacterium]